jgi:hypothetical protein
MAGEAPRVGEQDKDDATTGTAVGPLQSSGAVGAGFDAEFDGREEIDLAAEDLMQSIAAEPVPDRIDRLARRLATELGREAAVDQRD